MLQVFEEYTATWLNGDGDAAAAMVVSDFVMSYPKEDVTFTVDDGSFQRHVDFGWSGMVFTPPVFVGDVTLVIADMGSESDPGPGWTSYVQFTTSGDVLITRHTTVTQNPNT